MCSILNVSFKGDCWLLLRKHCPVTSALSYRLYARFHSSETNTMLERSSDSWLHLQDRDLRISAGQPVLVHILTESSHWPSRQGCLFL